MKKKLLKFFIIIGVLALLLTLISTTRVQAVLQSNPNTHYKKTDYSQYWMTYFREMETIGGALGLKEGIDTTTKLSTTESNNFDSHMMRSTEYGAIVILSVSGYGNSKKLQDSIIKTTTGNETGLYYSGTSWEDVAGGYSGSAFPGVDEIYYDAYGGNNTSAKVGDALGDANTINPGCTGWHSYTSNSWVIYSEQYLKRNIFSYARSYGYYNEHYYDKAHSRGVVVCGEGL